MSSFFTSKKDRDHRSSREAERAGYKLHELDGEVRELRKDLRRVQLAFQAMWELTAESSGITAEQLQAAMKEIDGRADESGHLLAPKLVSCPACSRNVLSDRPRCVYCGADMIPDAGEEAG